MKESYFGCCGMCVYFNLYDKYDRFGSKFMCTKYKHYYPANEKKCSKFENDSSRDNDLIEKAISNRL